MTQVVNNSDGLTYILTQYGLNRVAEALKNPDEDIYITKIKVGDANFEYYIPSENQTNLKHPIPGGEFFIVDKELLEDNLTVCFHTVFPETFDGCEIREIGIYETKDEVDHLFAISTQQPLVKPLVQLRYLIAVDYYAFLKSQNLADIYDQILLNPDNKLVTEEDLENLMSTILFSESNLMEQINGNTRVIGLNRVQQLQERMDKERAHFGYVAAYSNFTTLLDYTNSEDIFSYWIFNYPRRTTPSVSVVDIGKYGRNLTLGTPISSLKREYSGIMPMLSLPAPNYFMLDQGITEFIYNEGIFNVSGNPIISSEGIASNFSVGNYLILQEISFNTMSNWSIYFNFTLNDFSTDQTLLTMSNDYILKIYVEEATHKLKVKVGGGTSWKTRELSMDLVANTSYNIRVTHNETGYVLEQLEENTYSIEDSMSSTLIIPENFGNIIIGSGIIDGLYLHGTSDLKEFSIYQGEQQLISGGIYTSNNDMTLLNSTRTEDVSFLMLFGIKPIETGDRTLLARSDYATNTHVFEIIERENGKLEVTLFSDSSNYVMYSTGEGAIPREAHSLLLYYNASDNSLTVYINSNKTSIIKETTGTYNHMNSSPSILYAFTYQANKTIWTDNITTPTNLFNSNGTPYVGNIYSTSNNYVFYLDNPMTVDSSKNVETETLYAWVAPNNSKIYTKTTSIEANTKLYNEDYTEYTGSAFSITSVETVYVVTYEGSVATYSSTDNIDPRTLYAFSYTGSTQTIWANNNVTPSILYFSNGDLYDENNWFIENNVVRYKDGGVGVYTVSLDINIPSLPVTSFITNSDGNPDKYIGSNVGLISVVKSTFTEEQLRSIALNISALIGKNPCIQTF